MMASQQDEVVEQARAMSDSSQMGTVAKVCCVCSVDLTGKIRYKDKTGRYWCPVCNEKDQLGKQPAQCPDCNAQFTAAQLLEFKGTAVCPACWEKRKAAAKREESRLRAVRELEEAKSREHRHLKLMGKGLFALLVLWALIWVVVRFVF